MFSGGGLLQLVFTGDWISLFILLILVAMSALSWGVIGWKWLEFKRLREDEQTFGVAYRDRPVEEALLAARKSLFSALAKLMEAGHQELELSKAQAQKEARLRGMGGGRIPAEGEGQNRMLDRINRALERAYNQQMNRMEKRLSILAIISSSAPFVGLTGTVLGVIDAFQQIGSSGVTSLTVVAPGISQALVATAAGLITAVPALVAYNIFRNNLRETSAQMKNFALDIINHMDRNF
ncbi:MAG: MotA/TolQ/ExbB proton channel family protein [Deltaproteobacteria bacterium]|nr:MotA/TolQ/ExbB proton channel family protein [Deltaproteobacteria bacterium]